MKFSLFFFLLGAALSQYRGLNTRNWPTGRNLAFKTLQEWNTTFHAITTLPVGNDNQPFNAARVYSTTEGDGSWKYLPLIIPAARQYNISLLLGLYFDNSMDGGARFQREKHALQEAFGQFGTEGILGVSVGNEDLYENHTNPRLLAEQIQEVKDMLGGMGACDIPVGHTDTWGAWVDVNNHAVVEASDMLIANIFPYWQNITIDAANDTFWRALNSTLEMAQERGDGKDVWIGETGWATNKSFGHAVASLDNLQRYWNEIVCGSAFKSMNAFFYVDSDMGDDRGFGILDENYQPRIDLSCSGYQRQQDEGVV